MAHATGAPDRSASTSTHTFLGRAGASPPNTPVLAIQLAADNRLKSALHRLVLVLPLALLIFVQALQDPNAEIKLPLVEGIKVKIQAIMPMFFLIICYMLFRAMRYARIIVIKILEIPNNTRQLIDIVMDHNDAFKINSVYYDEVLDQTALEVFEGSQKGSWFVTTVTAVLSYFNLGKAILFYGAIFILLLFIAIFISSELRSFAAREFENLHAVFSSGSIKIVDATVLSIAAGLLFLSWLNAAIAFLALLITILVTFVPLMTKAAIKVTATLIRLTGFVWHFVHEASIESLTEAVRRLNELDDTLDKFERSGLSTGSKTFWRPSVRAKRWVLKNLTAYQIRHSPHS